MTEVKSFNLSPKILCGSRGTRWLDRRIDYGRTSKRKRMTLVTFSPEPLTPHNSVMTYYAAPNKRFITTTLRLKNGSTCSDPLAVIHGLREKGFFTTKTCAWISPRSVRFGRECRDGASRSSSLCLTAVEIVGIFVIYLYGLTPRYVLATGFI